MKERGTRRRRWVDVLVFDPAFGSSPSEAYAPPRSRCTRRPPFRDPLRSFTISNVDSVSILLHSLPCTLVLLFHDESHPRLCAAANQQPCLSHSAQSQPQRNPCNNHTHTCRPCRPTPHASLCIVASKGLRIRHTCE